MNMRWMKSMQEMLPTCDFQDLAYLKHKLRPKQFAAEFSQQAYEAMLAQDYAIGHYTVSHNQIRVSYLKYYATQPSAKKHFSVSER